MDSRQLAAKKGIERRRFKRFRESFRVRCLEVCGGRIGDCNLYDISAQGLGLVVRTRLQEQVPMRFWLHFPDQKKPLCTKGWVIWQRLLPDGSFRAGVSLDKPYFVGISRLFRS